MATPRNIPSVQYNTYFGNVGKVVWFEVVDNYNYFELYFDLTLQQSRRTYLQVLNYNLNQVAWENYYPSDANQEEYLDSVRVLYQPQANVDQPFAVINVPTN
jgi:hypothetical protein